MVVSSSPPPPQDRAEPPSMPPPPPTHPVSAAASRRLPPPCWSNEETAALIESYREKWYSLRRGHLKATHWQEVADAVAARSPVADPPKTSVQCRHKMEKLRKRYRAELQRSHSSAPNRPRALPSSWVHFPQMHSMEKGPTIAVAAVDSGTHGTNGEEEDDDEDEDDNEDSYSNGVKHHHAFPYNRRVNPVMSNGIGSSSSRRSGFRIKFPGGASRMAPSGTGFRHRNYENPNPNFGFGVTRDFSGVGKKRVEREEDAVGEMVEAVKVLGDGFVRMEKMKMEMARGIEEMRMEMEMKQTEMILESQQRIVEAFAKGLAEKKKKAKRLPSPLEP